VAGKEQTRQHILDTSLRLFVQNGYGSTTIRDIAAEARISVGLLFHYFDSKPALLEAHVKSAASGIDTALEMLESDGAALEIFGAIAEMTMAGLGNPTARLWYALVNQPLPADVVEAHLRGEELITRSAAVISRGQASGEIRPGNPYSLAMAFWGAVQGSALMLVGVEEVPAPEAAWLLGILKPE
jgi:AcrR family transcriptional regulator